MILVAALLQGCSRLLFFPQRALVRTPADVGLAYRDVSITAADGTALHGWWLPATGDPSGAAKGTVFFLHGNAENISTHIASVYWLPAAGYQVLLLDYRGFGRSAGKPRLPDVFTDVEAGFRWLREEPQAAARPLFLLGQSIGGALGCYVAGSNEELRAQLAGVVLDSTFARYSWVARDAAAHGWLTWPFQWPIAWSMPDGYDPMDFIGRLSPVPVLVIHGRRDDIVPYAHGEALFAAAREPRSFLGYDGPHIGGFMDARNRELLLEFFARPSGPQESVGR